MYLRNGLNYHTVVHFNIEPVTSPGRKGVLDAKRG